MLASCTSALVSAQSVLKGTPSLLKKMSKGVDSLPDAPLQEALDHSRRVLSL